MDYSYASSLRNGLMASVYKSKVPPDLPLETPAGLTMEDTGLLSAFEAPKKHAKKVKKKGQGKKKEIKKCRKRKDVTNEVRLRALADPTRMSNLRMKFLEQLKTYFGMPYAKKYWKPDEPEYSSPWFLDCCGLIRRAMRDLRKDFGFKIGPWNQGYMYDTLPITIENEQDMKPGDLVFIAATYYNTKMKKQKHDITHVEVWYGEGPKTIGSRWHRGHVQVFDSYAFDPKAYHSERYIFKSIDTWLMGICRSHCPQHQWKLRSENFKPGKKSVFSLQEKKKKEKKEENASDCEDSRVSRRPLQAQDSNRPERTPRGIAVDMDDDDDDESDDDSDDDTTTATGDTTSDATSITTTSSSATATTTTTTTTATEDASSVASSSVNDTQSFDSVSEISTTVSVEQARKNLNRDFANLSPREGKESDSQIKRNLKCVLSYSNGASPRITSPYTRLDTDLDGNPISTESQQSLPAKENQLPSESGSFVYDETNKTWTGADFVYDETSKRWISCEPVVEYGDDSDDERASVDSDTLQDDEEEENKIVNDNNDETLNPLEITSETIGPSVGCQTGVEYGDCVHVLGDDKWESPTNMFCYASVYKGDAMVQIKNPDLISECSSSSSGSCLGDDEGFSAQEQVSCTDAYTDIPKSAADMMLSLRKSPSLASEDSGFQRSENASTCFSSRPSSASSVAARVGSAGAFQGPTVATLYSDNSGDGSDSNHSNTSLSDGPNDALCCDEDADTPPGDNDGKQGVNTAGGTPVRGAGSSSTQTSHNKGKKTVIKKHKKGGDDRRPPEGVKSRINALSQPKEPQFVIAGGNGNALVESSLLEIGWKKLANKYDDNYKLKWVETKCSVNYHSFNGEKLVNRIPNCTLLTNKLGLLNSIHRYERVSHHLPGESRFSSIDFLPETYRIDEPAERHAFFEQHEDGQIWICKPCGLNQGKGIFLIRDIAEFQHTLEERDEREKAVTSHRPMQRIVQRYIEKPLLLDYRKFDIRCYMLIASTTPYLLCYHPGYCRLCLSTYSYRSESLTAHLTNQFVQKKDSNYNEYKEETVWSMERFNDYVNETYADQKGIDKNWVFNALTNRIKQIISYIFNAVKYKLRCRRGFFDLYGLDFMVDSDLKVYLIEVNANPSLATNCEVLKAVVPNVVRESLYLAIECFEKSKRDQPLLPLHCLTNFQLLYCGGARRPNSATRCFTSPRSLSPHKRVPTPQQPARRARSMSPEKKRETSFPIPTSQRSMSPEKETRIQSPLTIETHIQSPLTIETRIQSQRTIETRFQSPTSQPSISPEKETRIPIQTSEPSMSPQKKRETSIHMPTTQPTHVPSLRTEQSFTTTARNISARRARPLSTRIVTCPATPMSPRHGLRGALPVLDKSPNTSAGYTDMYKFKMTHAALLSAIKAEHAHRKVLTDSWAETESWAEKPVLGASTAVNNEPPVAAASHAMSQSLSQDHFSGAAQYIPQFMCSASTHNIANTSSRMPSVKPSVDSPPEPSLNPVPLQTNTTPVVQFSPSNPPLRPSIGVTKAYGRKFLLPTSSASVRSQVSFHSNSIPLIQKGRPGSNTGGVIGTALKRNDRGN